MPSLVVSPTVQAINTPSAGTAAGTIKPQLRTFGLTGLMGSVIVAGDEIELWGSNDGGTTFQPLRQGANQPVILNFANPEIVINDASTHYATRRRSAGTGSSLIACGFNGEAAANPLVQRGTTTLVAGSITVTGVTLTTSSSILLSMRDPGAAALTEFADFNAPVASRNVAAGSFLIQALDDTNGVLAAAVCTVDWAIIG